MCFIEKPGTRIDTKRSAKVKRTKAKQPQQRKKPNKHRRYEIKTAPQFYHIGLSWRLQAVLQTWQHLQVNYFFVRIYDSFPARLFRNTHIHTTFLLSISFHEQFRKNRSKQMERLTLDPP